MAQTWTPQQWTAYRLEKVGYIYIYIVYITYIC
jgi:hypothetical protein